MASVRVTSSRYIVRPSQRVTVNGVTRPDVTCASVTRPFGLVPAMAQLMLPFKLVGDDVDFLRDAEVVVWVGDGDRDPVFRGFVSGNGGVEAHRRNQVTARAVDILGLMDQVYVGQESEQGIVTYPRRDPRTGTENNWRVSTILTDIFGEVMLPLAWRNKVELGDMSGLQTFAATDIEVPDLAFVATPLIDALRKLLGLVPQVGVRTRFTSTKTLLDFYTIGSSGYGGRTISIPTATESAEEGAVVSGLVMEGDIEAIYTRVIGYGRPGETMITVSTLHETDPLEPVWEGNTFGYPATLPTYTDGVSQVSTGEAKLLVDPTRGVRGKPFFDESVEYAFRRFRLPVSLRGMKILQDNCLEDAGGQRLRIQVFCPALEWPTTIPVAGVTRATESATNWELVGGATLTSDGYITLPEPAVRTFGFDEATGAEVIQPVAVFVTLTLASADKAGLVYDTGVVGVSQFPGLSEEGMVFSFLNPTVRHEKIGSFDGEFAEGTAFGCTYWDGDAQAWVTVDPPATIDQCQIVRDDTAYLQNLCEQVLAQRSVRRTAATVMIPAVRTGYQVGDTIWVRNRGIDDKRLMVHQVIWDLFRPRTMLKASDQVPWAMEQAMRAVPEAQQGTVHGRQMGHVNMTGPGAGNYTVAPPGAMGVGGYGGQPMGPYIGPLAGNQAPPINQGPMGPYRQAAGLSPLEFDGPAMERVTGETNRSGEDSFLRAFRAANPGRE